MKTLTKAILIFILVVKAGSISAQATWVTQTTLTTQDFYSIQALTASSVFTVGQYGASRHTTDGGMTWPVMNIGTSNVQYKVHFINSSVGFIVGQNQDILKTINGGLTWSNIGGGITHLYDAHFFSANSGWVVGDIEVGYGFLYEPFTFNLVQVPALANKVIRGIHFANSTTGWIVGDGGLIMKTVNSGNSWTQQTSGITSQLNKVMFLNTNDGIAVGNDGKILRTLNGGTNWNLLVSNTTKDLNSVFIADWSNIWACGDSGTVVYSNDAGTTWNPEASGTTEDLNAIHGVGTTDIWSCGNNGIIIYRSAGTAVSDHILKTGITTYPNPALNELHFKTNVVLGLTEYSIYNSSGLKKAEGVLRGSEGVDVSKLPPGLYFYSLANNGDHICNGKFVKE